MPLVLILYLELLQQQVVARELRELALVQVGVLVEVALMGLLVVLVFQAKVMLAVAVLEVGQITAMVAVAVLVLLGQMVQQLALAMAVLV
jgi:hypothetical protein